ncbi:unnamed protein product [Paramecium primaurelia]|uniref:Uncharacterized protein n=1 Tax=Paramecium primaurelia TaxID=5886 RepID=A0A8S1NES6_PARPR|nr:unnamed protein product [Paramecium primaurelia]
MNFKEDPKNLIIPLDLAKIIYDKWDADLAILDQPDQVYGKALHGKGEVTFKNGNKYEGEFHNGMLHGEGTFTWASGVIYKGEFTYNKIEGQGTYYWPEGSTYTGIVVNGLRHGQGKFVTADKSAVYEGQWENGLRHGFGKITFKSGATFEGQFYQGNKSGKGKMIYPSGNYYDGDFLMDKKEGQGVMFWLNSNEKYYGEWKDNVQNGWGVHLWIEPKGEGSKYLRNRYEGEWENGERSGVGVFYYANGAKYMGSWKNNLKYGVALFITDTGGFILGEFKQDRLIKVYATTENESRTGILPREIAPQGGEVIQQNENPKEVGDNKDRKKDNKDNNKDKDNKDKDKDKDKNKLGNTTKRPEKLAGINNPNQTQTNLNKTIETNPYSYMIDFSDLYKGLQLDSQQIDQNVQTMLLRHNYTLKTHYKFFANKFESLLYEDTFSLSLEGFWKIARDAKLLNQNYSLAELNRNFLQGSKNNYRLKYDRQELNVEIDVLSRQGSNINLQELNDLFHQQMAFDCLSTEKINYQDFQLKDVTFKKKVEDIHDPRRCILFRHFIELIVRLSYLKYGNLIDLHRAIERVIISKLTPYFERKKGKQNQSLDDTKKSTHPKIIIGDFIDEVKPIFDVWSIENRETQFGFTDRTINLEQIYKLLNASEQDKLILISYVDKNFDTDEGQITQQSISQIDQSSVNQTIREDGNKRRKKQQDQTAEKDQRKTLEKSTSIIKYELLLFEFTDILTSFLVKKHKDLHTNKEDEFKIRMSNHIKKLKNRKPPTLNKYKQPRLEPQTQKDIQKEQLKQLRIQQEIKARQRKLLEEERKQEERERNLMALEDNDIKSEHEDDEVESEESDY